MKLSIITINYNNKAGLQKTINSIISQTFKDFEWIIIDGGSTDGSKELIEQYSQYTTFWVSEPDNGIYNAMNKGILTCNGEYILFLNSGDWLNKNNSLKIINQHEFTEDFVIFDIILSFPQKEIVRNLDLLKDNLFAFLYQDTFPHQSTLIKRSIFTKYGLYEEQHKYVADWLLSFKACILNNATYKYCKGIILTKYDMTGTSSINYSEVIKERRSILNNYLSPSFINCCEEYIKYINIKNTIKSDKITYLLFKIILWISNKLS